MRITRRSGVVRADVIEGSAGFAFSSFCEGLEVLELILPTRWHLLLLLVVKEKQGKWASTSTKARRKGTPNATRAAHRLLTTQPQLEIVSGSR
jgi:hypothetical protein